MRGLAIVDRQEGDDEIAIWVVSRTSGLEATSVNAVVVNAAEDPEAAAIKVRSLTRACAVVVTEGSDLSGLPVEGQPLTQQDLDTLARETSAQRQNILDAIAAYKTRSSSKSLTEPSFPEPRDAELFLGYEDTARRRAFNLATYVCHLWTSWLKTDEERRRRTVRPRSNETPWIMPLELNQPAVADFPPGFVARLIEQPLV